MNANNIVVLHTEPPELSVPEEKLNPSVILLTPKDSDQAIVRKILDDSCELTACSSVKDFNSLMKRARNSSPELVIVRDLLLKKDPETLKALADIVRRHIPVLILGKNANRKFSSFHAKSGIRDNVSLDEAGRMRFIVRRELKDYRVRCAYKRSASCVAKYRRQIRALTKLTKKTSGTAVPEVANATDNNVVTTTHGRARFLSKLSRRLAKTHSRGVRVLAWIRPDRFSSVEAALGVIASEDALEHVASVLRNLQHPGDISGRIGGTVFAVLLERGAMEEVEAWVQQFYRSLNERPFVTDGKSAQLSCTTGLCEVGGETLAIDDILAEAHDACRRGRLQGEGHIFLSASSKSASSARLQNKKWANRIKHALRKNRFQLVHSPVVRLDGDNDKIRDTWVRMIDEKGNTILPSEFMPVAKQLGLMTLIDRWVIAATLSYCIKRKPNLVFVRLSKSTILDDTIVSWIEKVFSNSEVKPSQVCFQISADVATRHMTQVVRQANKLNELEFKFAVAKIDSKSDKMEVLDLVPMQYARIDVDLSQRVANDKVVQDKVAKIISAAKNRGIIVVADRIEDAATMATLCQMNVEFMQGDYLRRDNIVMEDTMTVCKPILPLADVS